MVFLIFMILITLLVPLTLIFFGNYFIRHAPADINAVFGYRTKMSMKNKQTWEFAHKYIGKLWLRLGLIMLPFSIIPMIFTAGKTEDVIGITGGVIEFIQIALMIFTIFPTEKALKKNFDKYGKRL